jgi:hypothetical protein
MIRSARPTLADVSLADLSFGRTPMGQGEGKKIGRDHHIKGFSMVLAGGGIKGGVTHGATGVEPAKVVKPILA